MASAAQGRRAAPPPAPAGARPSPPPEGIPWVAVAVSAGVLVVLALVLSSSGRIVGVEDVRASTERPTPDGTLALYLVLEELGVPVERRMLPIVEGGAVPGALALLGPAELLTPREAGALLDRVRAGGTLLYAARPTWMGDVLLDSLDLTLTLLRDPAGRAEPEPHPLTDGLEPISGFRSLFIDSAFIALGGEAAGEAAGGVAEEVAGEAAGGVVEEVAGGSAAAASDGPVVLYRAGRARVYALVLPLGEGRVIALSDVEPLVNGALGESGAAPLMARLAADITAPGRPLHFDEYHHGLRGGTVREGMATFLAGTGWGHLVLQLAGVGLLGILLVAWRFGAPRRPPPERRRSPMEHVDALAQVYREARAVRTPRLLLLAGLARHMRRPRPRTPEEAGELLDTLQRVAPPGVGAIDALRAAMVEDDRNLLAVADGVDRVRKEILR